jgi:4-deoxy-L-threo-5-hexosulose-uronate ketol-isomerase
LADAINKEFSDMLTIDVRQATHPDHAKRYDTAELRQHFHIEGLFQKGEIRLTYTHVDRFVVGGAVPLADGLSLTAPKPIGTKSFMDRRELGVINIGGAGSVTVGGESHALARGEALYVGRGAGEVMFHSASAKEPARFYLLSTPAHATHPTVRITMANARRIDLGAAATANVRTIFQMIHPDVCASCQLVMGMTKLNEGSVWNTMPAHIHDRRSEVYLYLDLAPDARVFHLMGEPQETRHIVMANEEAIISPGWSVHSGCGTSNYSFIWAMAGDNQDFTDMDFIAMDALR